MTRNTKQSCPSVLTQVMMRLRTRNTKLTLSNGLQTLISYLHAWGIANNDIILEPLLRPHSQHYSGAIFQVHLVDEAETGATSLVAVGTSPLCRLSLSNKNAGDVTNQLREVPCTRQHCL